MARQAPVLGGGTVNLEPAAFEARFNMPLVHETVRAELNARRRGTAATKTRGKVSGGGAKPWRQKGTGRARAGSSRSPLWAGGGTVFGPRPAVTPSRSTARPAARRCAGALSMHAERESLAVFDAGVFDAPNDRPGRGAARRLGRGRSHAGAARRRGGARRQVVPQHRRASTVMPVSDAGVADIVGAASMLVSQTALPELIARAAGAHDDNTDEEAGS